MNASSTATTTEEPSPDAQTESAAHTGTKSRTKESVQTETATQDGMAPRTALETASQNDSGYGSAETAQKENVVEGEGDGDGEKKRATV